VEATLVSLPPKAPTMTKRSDIPPVAELPAQSSLQAPMPCLSRKQTAVFDMLSREAGASLAELTATTGWLPHTARAALSGLRKRGLTITRAKVGDETRYTITAA
jgi:hypothetical protein